MVRGDYFYRCCKILHEEKSRVFRKTQEFDVEFPVWNKIQIHLSSIKKSFGYSYVDVTGLASGYQILHETELT